MVVIVPNTNPEGPTDRELSEASNAAFYRGLGGLAARSLGEISQTDQAAMVADVLDTSAQHQATIDGLETALAAAQKAQREALEDTKDPIAHAAAVRAEEDLKKQLAASRKTATQGAVDATYKLTDISRKPINPAADEEYTPPARRLRKRSVYNLVPRRLANRAPEFIKRRVIGAKQERDAFKVGRLVDKISADQAYVNRAAVGDYFRSRVDNTELVTNAWIKGERARLKHERDEGIISDAKYSEEIDHLKHLKKHKKEHPIESALEPGQSASVEKSKIRLQKEADIESNRVALDRIINRGLGVSRRREASTALNHAKSVNNAHLQAPEPPQPPVYYEKPAHSKRKIRKFEWQARDFASQADVVERHISDLEATGNQDQDTQDTIHRLQGQAVALRQRAQASSLQSTRKKRTDVKGWM